MGMRQKRLSTPVCRFAALIAGALALQGIPVLFTRMDGDGGMLLYLIHLYAVLPLCAFSAPFWAGRGGVHPFAGCFPIGGALLMLPVYESPGMGLAFILLSLIGCVAGQEWEKRKNPKKGTRHGGKRKM